MADRIRRIFNFDRGPIDFDRTAFEFVSAHDGSGRFRPATVHKAGDTQNFALAEFERYIFNSIVCQPHDLKHISFTADLPSCNIHGAQSLSQHMRDQVILGQVLVLQHGNDRTIPHDSNPVTELKNLIHAVGDINDGHLFLFQRVNDVHQDMYFTVGENCCWLIKHDYPGFPV